MKKRIAVLIAAGLLLTGGVAACSDSTNSSKSATDMPAPAAPGSVPTGATNYGGGDNGKAGPPQADVTLAPSDVQRAIIYTGTITLRVKNVAVAVTAVEGIATGAGGYRSNSNVSTDGGSSSGTVVIRVPAGAFDSTVTSLDSLGTELDRQISSQDVTTQVVDVQSRLKTEQASVDRIRALIAQTKSIGEIVSLEDELTNREADLESMEAQLRALTDLTSLSTITVNLYGPEAHVVLPPAPKKTGFVNGLKSGWHGFLASMTVVLTVVGAVLPFVVIIGVPVWLIIFLIRRRRNTRKQPPAPLEPSA
jgi:peptidoglycan hydrolase CwlO-like protein